MCPPSAHEPKHGVNPSPPQQGSDRRHPTLFFERLRRRSPAHAFAGSSGLHATPPPEVDAAGCTAAAAAMGRARLVDAPTLSVAAGALPLPTTVSALFVSHFVEKIVEKMFKKQQKNPPPVVEKGEFFMSGTAFAALRPILLLRLY